MCKGWHFPSHWFPAFLIFSFLGSTYTKFQVWIWLFSHCGCFGWLQGLWFVCKDRSAIFQCKDRCLFSKVTTMIYCLLHMKCCHRSHPSTPIGSPALRQNPNLTLKERDLLAGSPYKQYSALEWNPLIQLKKKQTTKCSDLLLKLLEKVKGVFPENSRLEKSFLCSWFCIQLNSVEQTYSYLNIFLVLTSIVTAGQWTCRVPGTLVSLLCVKDILLQYPDRGSEVV